MFSKHRFIFVALSFCLVANADSKIQARECCSNDFTLCRPKGASAVNAPGIGSSLSTLFVDLLDSINKVQNVKRDMRPGSVAKDTSASAGSICCADGTQCLLLQGYALPFCYDKFTTNYVLPGGAYGQVVSGNYTAANGVANLLTGSYSLTNGSKGNIYGSPSSPAKPDTATLTMPTQYTATGIGSAIPVSDLGEWITYTTTIPGTTRLPTTIAAHMLAASVVSGTTIRPATTEPAMTLAGTTAAPKTDTFTSRSASATANSNQATTEFEASKLGSWVSIILTAPFLIHLLL